MKQYVVTGMSCAACQSRVEKAVSAVEGVTSCSVNLLTNTMGVEGNASDSAIISAVKNAGYGAYKKDKNPDNKTNEDDELFKDTETPKLKRRLISSICLLVVLMYISMGHMMWNFPLPLWLSENHIAMGLTELLLTIAIMIINGKFFISGFKSLVRFSPNMDALVALGSSFSFIWSVYALFMMSDAQIHGTQIEVMQWMDEFYFESAAMILTLITAGKMLEARSKGKTTDAIKSLMKLTPKTATVIRDNEEIIIKADDVNVGDIFIVKPGESIPVDGVVLDGITAVDESALTGESIPSDKSKGDTVYTATINESGYIRCKATKVREDTTLSQIIKMVTDASATKAPIAKVADKVSGVFVPIVMSISLLTFIVWLLLKSPFDYALSRAISVLVISCPCALGLATPVAIMVGNGVGARNGILFKTAVSLEETGKTQIVALDKTGTITNGEPEVTQIIPHSGITENELLESAFSAESKSEHPLAKAIIRLAKERNIKPDNIKDFKALIGNGLIAKSEKNEYIAGSYKYVSSVIDLDESIKEQAKALSKDGNTPLLFVKNKEYLGIIAVADTIKEESANAIKELKNMGILSVMITGDNIDTANAIGKKAGVDYIVSDVMPNEKESVIQKLKELSKVIMVGDGINDAPALSSADIGIAIGNGTDIAIESADIVLMNSKLSDVCKAIRLSRKTLKNIYENLFWAFIYNVLGIPLAAGCFVSLLGFSLSPMFAAAAMSLSSFCVVTNALRLNLFKISNTKYDKKSKRAVNADALSKQLDDMFLGKEEKKMTKTMKIEGMMCAHCEARVKATLEAIENVEKAEVSHDNGTAVVTLSNDVADDTLKQAIEAQGYPVISVE